MSLFTGSCLATGLLSLLFGAFVVYMNPRGMLNILWFSVSFSVALWSIGLGMMTSALNYSSATFWLQVHYLGAILIPVVFLHFVLQFEKRSNNILLVGGYGLAALFIVFSNLGLLVDTIPRPGFNFYTEARNFYPLYVLFFFSSVTYAHYLLINYYRRSGEKKREQVKYLFIGSGLGFLGGSTAFFPVFNWPIFPYGMYLVAIYIALIGYSIVRYHLMNITVVVNRSLAYALLLALIIIPTYLGVFVSERATLYSLPPLLAGTLVFSFGFWVLFRNPRASPNVLFGLVCLSVCFWLFGSFLSYSTTEASEALLWQKVIYVGLVFIPALFFHFCSSFLQLDKSQKWITGAYALSVLFLLAIPTNLLIQGVELHFWGYYSTAGLLHPLFLIYFGSVSGVSLLILYRGYREKANVDLLEAKRTKYIFWAFLIGFAASSDFPQVYGYDYYPVGFGFVTLLVVIVTYAIIKYQVLEIEISLERAKIGNYAGYLIIIPFYFLTLGLIWLFTQTVQYVLSAILVATLPLVSGYVRDFLMRIENIVGRTLFKERQDAYDTLKEFSTAMVNILDLKDLNKKIITTLSRVMGIERVSLFLLDPAKDTYSLVESDAEAEGRDNGTDSKHLEDNKIPGEGRLPRYFKESNHLILKEEMEHWLETYPNEDIKEIVIELSRMKSELCIPLMTKDQLIGFLSLGKKKNNSMYTREDVNLLSTLAQNTAIALDNALMYEDLKRQKILMRRTDRMRSLETMAGGFAHEIRNPLTSIKTFVQLAPQRRDDEEFVDHFSKVVSEDVHRIERLIQEILDYARYMQPRLSEEDLNDVVESSLYFIGVKSEGKGISVEKVLAKDIPRVLMDRQQIKQVLLNLFLNALDAMPNGGRLIVRTHRLAKEHDGDWVQIEVCDTGMGISEIELEHIFDPFFTTKHESEEREGTGLGLSIVHQIIQEHRGHVDVTSKLHEGTTFYISLPVNPIRYERRKPEVEVS
jgi:two-component system, NtrC family, sensor kinase